VRSRSRRLQIADLQICSYAAQVTSLRINIRRNGPHRDVAYTLRVPPEVVANFQPRDLFTARAEGRDRIVYERVTEEPTTWPGLPAPEEEVAPGAVAPEPVTW
jgi:hypothetical protein